MRFQVEDINKWVLVAATFGLSISYSSVYLFHVLMAVQIIVSLTSNRFKMSFPLLDVKEGLALLGFACWYVLSLIWSIDITESLKYLFYIFCGLYIVHILLQFSNSIPRFMLANRLILGVMLIELAFCLLEVFTSFRLPVSPMSEVLPAVGRDNSSRLYLELSTPTGFRWNPNDLAVSLAIFLPFVALSSSKWLKFIVAPIVALIIVMTSSRGVFISILFGTVGYLLLYHWKYFVRITVVGAVLLALFIANIDAIEKVEIRQVQELAESYQILQEYLLEESKESETSIGVRKHVMELGAKALRETAYVGVGAGGSVAYLKSYGGVGAHQVASMHNFWLELLVDAGVIVGVLLILSYLGLIYKSYFISVNSEDAYLKGYAKSMTVALIIFIVGAISASSTIYLFPMWLLLGLCFSLFKIHKSQEA